MEDDPRSIERHQALTGHKRVSQIMKDLWANPEQRKIRYENTLKERTAPEARKRASENIARSWKNPKVRARRLEGMSKAMKRRWANPEQRKAMTEMIKRTRTTPEARKLSGERAKRRWADPQIRRQTIQHMSNTWKRIWANAPPEKRQRVGDHTRRLWAQRNVMIRAAQRPTDWDDKRIEWRIIGTELLSKDYMSNKELAKRLDNSRIVKCPYGETWETALSRPGRAANQISEIRKWLNRPGKSLMTKRPSIPPPVTA